MPVAVVSSVAAKSQAAAQYLVEADDKKDKVVTEDEIDWPLRLEVQQLYERALLCDLDHSVGRHAEQNLWNFCYKNPIDTLHRRLKNRKNDADTAALIKFLSASLGFFSQLHTKVSIVYRFSAPGFKSLPELGVISDHFAAPMTAEKDHLVYITHFCMIHMGDLYRYQKKVTHAESYYLHAAKISPSSGHPFNQLAILEMGRADKLSSVYFYVRSLFVRNPFLLAASNLERFYALVVGNYPNGKKPVTTAANYVSSFLHFHAVLDTSNDLKEAEANLQVHTDELFDEVIPSLETASVTRHQILQMLVIDIGAMWKILNWPLPDCDRMIISGSGETFLEETNLDANFRGLGDSEKIQYQLLVKLFVQQLANLMKFCAEATDQAKKFEFAAAVKIGLDWLRINHETLSATFIPTGVLNDFLLSLCEYLNRMQAVELKRAKPTKEAVPLHEDVDLMGFLPLESYHKGLDFETAAPTDLKQIQRAQAVRMTNFGRWLVGKLAQPDLLNTEVTEGGKSTFSTKVVKSRPFSYPSGTTKAELKQIEDQSKNVEKTASVASSEGSPEHKPGTPTAVKRQSKLVAMKTILSKNAAAASEEQVEAVKSGAEEVHSRPPTKITIAASGSRVELPLVTDRPEFKDSTSQMGSITIGKNGAGGGGNSSASRFELPPRFQAARLKLALGSNQPPPSIYTSSGSRPESQGSADELHYQHPSQSLGNPGPLNFPPLSMVPRMSTMTEMDRRGGSILANFTESKEYSLAAPVDHRLRSESLGGDDMVEPIGGASNFPKTPGVRPNLPPQFLFGAGAFPMSTVSHVGQTTSLVPSFPPPRLLRPESSEFGNRQTSVTAGFNQQQQAKGSNETGLLLETNPWSRQPDQNEQQRQDTSQKFPFGLPFATNSSSLDESRKGIPTLPAAPPRPPFLPFFPSFDPTRPPPNPSALPHRLPFAQLSSQQQNQPTFGGHRSDGDSQAQQANSTYSLFSSPWPTSYPHYPQWSPNDGGNRDPNSRP